MKNLNKPSKTVKSQNKLTKQQESDVDLTQAMIDGMWEASQKKQAAANKDPEQYEAPTWAQQLTSNLNQNLKDNLDKKTRESNKNGN